MGKGIFLPVFSLTSYLYICYNSIVAAKLRQTLPCKTGRALSPKGGALTMAKLNENYETIMIFNTKNGDEAIKALVEKFTGLIEKHATLGTVEEWGKRRLAYPIEDEVEGYYVYATFTSAPEFPTELDRNYKITDGVLRSLIVKKDN
jgi:small subunit ribosomal protein S6